MRALIAFMLIGTVCGFHFPAPTSKRSIFRPTMTLNKLTLHFDFRDIPYAAGVHHIHSPEQISETHRIGAPLFKIESIEPPRIAADKSSISFVCSTVFTQNVRVRMFASQPNVSNLIFFKDNRALYSVRLSVVPLRAFTSHRLRLDMALFTEDEELRITVKSLMPMILFVNRMSDLLSIDLLHENPLFMQYRRAVLRGKGSDEFWIMAERVMREYSGDV